LYVDSDVCKVCFLRQIASLNVFTFMDKTREDVNQLLSLVLLIKMSNECGIVKYF
jgi:hypothetical protein